MAAQLAEHMPLAMRLGYADLMASFNGMLRKPMTKPTLGAFSAS
jgi:hypothetical protein